MFYLRSYSGLLLLCCFYFSNIAATTNWVIQGDTHAASIHSFNILPHSLQRLSYSSGGLEIIHPSRLQWPTRMIGSYGLGHREAITESRHVGLYGFVDGCLDATSLYHHSIEADQRTIDYCYDRFFFNLNIGFEVIENPLQITVNVTLPLKNPFIRLEKAYLTDHTVEHNVFDEIVATFPTTERTEQKKTLQQRMGNTFYKHNGQQWQRYYYVEEGSYGLSIKARYRVLNHLHIAMNGYGFYDPYDNIIVGFSTRFDYLYSDKLTLYTQYTYDTARSWHLLGGVQWTVENKILKPLASYHQLWHTPNRHTSPLLIRSHHPRQVNAS